MSRVCLIYDCLFPHTVGGAERWYRHLAERLAAAGHQVTYVTLTQWDPGGPGPDLAGVRVVAVGPRMELYEAGGRRRIGPPVRFGAGVLWHLLRHGRDYDVVHTCSFPYFSLLAAGLLAPLGRYRLIVDWIEVWSREYWRDYLGPVAGPVGYAVQRACTRIPQEAFCLSRLHAARLRAEGLRGEVAVLTGAYTGTLEPPDALPADPVAVFAGRLIPEKRAPLAVAAMAAAARRVPGLRGVVYGDGPARAAVARAARAAGGAVTLAGFVDAAVIDQALRRALCMVLTSQREGYGMVVVEAAARATPSIVVAGPDNAATELVEHGVNGLVVAEATAEAVADAIVAVHRAGPALRASTAAWFARHAHSLTLDSSLERVLAAYAGRPPSARS